MTETTKRLPVVEHALALAALPPGMTKRSYLGHRLTPSSHLVDERGGRLAYYRNLARRGRAL
jgi:hypothetical protein